MIPRSRRAFVAGAGAAAAFALARRSADADDAPPNPPAVARRVVTHDQVRLRSGASLPYTATASTLILEDERGAPSASIFSVAYTTGEPGRPVTFCSNGGPGSSSVWLHLGAFGPRRVVTTPGGFTPAAAFRLADNGETLLDRSDLVFIDPVGTGYSTLAGKATNSDFWGIDQDLRAFSQFIRRWRVLNRRTTDPVFVLGESYGTFRSAGLAGRLQHDGVRVNGVVLISPLLDYADDFGSSGTGESLTDAFAIPTEAAVAWYHKHVADPAPTVADAVDRARTFARDVYLPAMMQPGPLDEATRARLAQQLHALIGLDPAFLERAHLRVAKERFESELLRSAGRVIGRYDGRATGVAVDHNGATPDFDPSYESIAPAFTALFAAYASATLRWPTTNLYRVLPDDVGANWNFRRDDGDKILAPSVIPDLRDAMHTDPNLRVFSAHGYYDLATPLYAGEVELADVGLDPAVASRISFGRYPSGHMIYLSADALAALRADLETFYAHALEPA